MIISTPLELTDTSVFPQSVTFWKKYAANSLNLGSQDSLILWLVIRPLHEQIIGVEEMYLTSEYGQGSSIMHLHLEEREGWSNMQSYH